MALAHILHERGKVLPAELLYLKALALDPNNPDALTGYSLLLASVGRVKQALPLRQALLAEEPFVPNFTGNTAVVQWLNGQTEIAIATLNTLTRNDSSRGLYLPRIYATAGRYKEAADALGPATLYPSGAMEEAARLLRTAPKRVPSPQNLPRLGNLGFVYLYVGASDRMLEFYEDALQAGYSVNVASSFLWHPSYAPIRNTARFKAYARKAGLVEYWRAKGWPELCHPTTADDFACS